MWLLYQGFTQVCRHLLTSQSGLSDLEFQSHQRQWTNSAELSDARSAMWVFLRPVHFIWGFISPQIFTCTAQLSLVNSVVFGSRTVFTCPGKQLNVSNIPESCRFHFTFSRAHLNHSGEKRYVCNGFLYRRQFKKIVKGKMKVNLKNISEITVVSNCNLMVDFYSQKLESI